MKTDPVANRTSFSLAKDILRVRSIIHNRAEILFLPHENIKRNEQKRKGKLLTKKKEEKKKKTILLPPRTDLCRQVLPPLEQDYEKTPKQLQRVVVEHRAYRLRSFVSRVGLGWVGFLIALRHGSHQIKGRTGHGKRACNRNSRKGIIRFV